MRLLSEEVERFREDGYLFFPGLLSAEEIGTLGQDLPALMAGTGPGVFREQGNPESVRLIYGGHKDSEAFRRLTLLPRLLGPVRQLLGEDVYIHQTRINPKREYDGAAWSWHQDFGTWGREDGLPAPKLIMTAVFIDAATPVNAPLLIVPGSQRHGMIAAASLQEGTPGSYVVMEIARDTLAALAGEGGIVPLMGPPGSVAFLHCNIVHGSSNNITPYRRAIAYINYNAVSNHARSLRRPPHFCEPDFTALEPLDDDSLLDLADERTGPVPVPA